MHTISAVSYLNTKPFLYGLEHTDLLQNINLVQHFPAMCAEKLISGEVDIGLVPVAVIPLLTNPQIVAPYCIGADGKVDTVCLFSEVPLEEIETIYLDYQSRTSVQLVQILCREYWKKEVLFANAFPGYESEIGGKTAGVVIGDRAIHLHKRFSYVYDLAEHWKLHTGLPFVFAAWVSCRTLPSGFLAEFAASLQYGLDHRAALFSQFAQLDSDYFSVEKYFMETIHYSLTPQLQQGLELFMRKLHPDKQVMYCF